METTDVLRKHFGSQTLRNLDFENFYIFNSEINTKTCFGSLPSAKIEIKRIRIKIKEKSTLNAKNNMRRFFCFFGRIQCYFSIFPSFNYVSKFSNKEVKSSEKSQKSCSAQHWVTKSSTACARHNAQLCRILLTHTRESCAIWPRSLGNIRSYFYNNLFDGIARKTAS